MAIRPIAAQAIFAVSETSDALRSPMTVSSPIVGAQFAFSYALIKSSKQQYPLLPHIGDVDPNLWNHVL